MVVFLRRRIVHELFFILCKHFHAQFFQIFILEVLCFFQNIRVHLLRLFRRRFNKIADVHRIIGRPLPDSHHAKLLEAVPLCYSRSDLNDIPLFNLRQRRKLFVGNIPLFSGDFTGLVAQHQIQILFFIGADFHSNGFYHKKVRHFLRGPDIRDINLFHSDGSLPKR